MQHIGFIMDGNRRWAKKYGNISKVGHEMGGKKFREVIEWCYESHIPYASFWVLSKENILERHEDEIAGIYEIARTMMRELSLLAHGKHFSIRYVGDITLLPGDLANELIHIEKNTRDYTNMTIILAIAYSGQDEIIRGMRRYIESGASLASLDGTTFLSYLDTGAYPPPDLIIRTGGVVRHSGYFLYQSAYSEYFFSDLLWPDFTRIEFIRALDQYHSTKRNFGK